MITEEMLKKIANVFNGDDENSIYEYKTGSDLVRFLISTLIERTHTKTLFHQGGGMLLIYYSSCYRQKN
ncbi:hypothetical protein UM650_02715 [Staphylococcus aureus]|uniref:hypothetical protein n=1 Tax=Staphylococcus aureus TaxID=1280 RepID=UPI00308DAA12|nr:hypothetical protein UM650_02715 [Staphylococcus aureus]